LASGAVSIFHAIQPPTRTDLFQVGIDLDQCGSASRSRLTGPQRKPPKCREWVQIRKSRLLRVLSGLAAKAGMQAAIAVFGFELLPDLRTA
jgi:hypothetical protein